MFSVSLPRFSPIFNLKCDICGDYEYLDHAVNLSARNWVWASLMTCWFSVARFQHTPVESQWPHTLSHLWGWGSIPDKSCSFLIVSLSRGLSLCFMCSDQHVKYRMLRGFLSTRSLLLDYHVKQYIHTLCVLQQAISCYITKQMQQCILVLNHSITAFAFLIRYILF